MLQSFFEELRAKDILLTIITKGYVGAVKKLLLEERLLDNFDTVIGFTGHHYGETEYDELVASRVSELEGGQDDALQMSKADFIRTLLEREGLKTREAVLVEDDPAEIASVRQICRAVFVRKRQGMMSEEMGRLRHLTSFR